MALRYDAERRRFDLSLIGGQMPSLQTDHGLETAVTASLFTDRRAREDDALPDGSDRRGFWGEAWPAVGGVRMGSRLWLLDREIITSETVARVREYGTEALQWLTQLGVAQSATFDAVRDRAAGRWVISGHALIKRPAGQIFERRFADLWDWMGRNS
jgi:phage gp46-like protein